jgi:hypothetical protein
MNPPEQSASTELSLAKTMMERGKKTIRELGEIGNTGETHTTTLVTSKEIRYT